MTSSSIRAFASIAAEAARRATRYAAALKDPTSDYSEHVYAATQLRAAAADLLREAEAIEATIQAERWNDALFARWNDTLPRISA